MTESSNDLAMRQGQAEMIKHRNLEEIRVGNFLAESQTAKHDQKLLGDFLDHPVAAVTSFFI